MISGTLAAGLYGGLGVGVSVAILDSDVMALADTNATLSAGGTVSILALSGAEEKSEGTYLITDGNDGVTYYQKEGTSDYYTVPDDGLTQTSTITGIRAGSDGSVVRIGDAQEDTKQVNDLAVGYSVGTVSSQKDLTIRIPGRNTSLLDGNDSQGANGVNLVSQEGINILSSAPNGSIGTQENPVEMSAGEGYEIKLLNLNAQKTVETNTYVEVPVDGGDYAITPGTTVSNGAELNIVTRNGRIYCPAGTDASGNETGIVLVTEGGTLILNANVDEAYNQNNPIPEGQFRDGKILLPVLMADDGATATLVAEANVETARVNAENATITMESTWADLRFNRIDGVKSTVSLKANGSLGLLDDSKEFALIRFDKLDSNALGAALSLETVLGDIGTQAKPVHLDIPAEVTLQIPSAQNYYLAAFDYRYDDSGEPYLPSAPFYAIYKGDGMDGEPVNIVAREDLDGYLAYSDQQFFYVALPVQTEQALLDLIMAGKGAGWNWLEALDQDKLYQWISGLDETALAAATGETVAGALLRAKPKDGKETIACLKALPAGTNIATAFAACIEKGLFADMADLLTETTLLGMIQKAIEAGATPLDHYVDTSRALNVEVGVAAGNANITNRGNISVQQQYGDMNIANVYSERGDVRLTALGYTAEGIAESGNIFNAASDGQVAVDACEISLTANGHIGTAAKPFLVEERGDHPVRVVNVDEALYDGSGATDYHTLYGLAFVTMEQAENLSSGNLTLRYGSNWGAAAKDAFAYVVTNA